jgi:hypothetical protein
MKKVIQIKTNLGNRMLEDCLSGGWKKTSEYSSLMFDKGIDYDAYTIEKGHKLLEFEWTNWEEWEISGSEEAIDWLIKQYQMVSGQAGKGRLG